jgi:hypothetical protein
MTANLSFELPSHFDMRAKCTTTVSLNYLFPPVLLFSNLGARSFIQREKRGQRATRRGHWP